MFFTKKRTRRRNKPPQRRYVYLMERVSNRDWDTVFSGQREIKIGIAKDARRRRRTVDLGIPGKVIILDKYKVDKASRVETLLHNMFKDKNFKVKGAKRGAGGTEFFKLSNRDIRQVKRILRRKERQSMPVFLKIVFVSIILVYFLHQLT